MTAVKNTASSRVAKPHSADKRPQMELLLHRRITDALKQSRLAGEYMAFEVAVGPEGQWTIGKPEIQEAAGKRGGSLETELAAARDRGRALAISILSREDMVSAEKLAKFLGTTRATVNAKRQKHELLGLEGFKRGYRFPLWQLGKDGKPFSAIPALFESLGSPWAVYRFLVQPHAELDGLTGRDALGMGQDEFVLDAAQSIASGTFT